MGDTAVATAKFVSLIGDELWGKRMANLRAGLKRSAFEAKVIVDYFWLELVIDDACTQEGREILEKAGAVVDLLAAQSFATTIVQVHDHLTKRGKNALVGRLRAALQSEGGMAPLYIEMEVTRQLWDAGFEVTFTDLEGLANFDLLFRNARADGEVECKAISVDAGRKIHRKHFYRFIDAVSEQIASHIEGGADDIVIVDLDDRLPSEAAKHEELRLAFVEFLAGSRASDRGSFFSLTRETFSKRFSQEQLASQATFHEGCRKLYGSTCHISGGLTPDRSSAAIVVMRSQREDDPSKAILDALKEAADQFSKTRPGFIAIQLNDLVPTDLIGEGIRGRSGILSNHVLRDPKREHVVAALFTAYGGLVSNAAGVGCPAFAFLNPEKIKLQDYAPFLQHMPDDQFAELLGAVGGPKEDQSSGSTK